MEPTVLAAAIAAGAAVLGATLAALGSLLTSRSISKAIAIQLEAERAKSESVQREARNEWWRERRLIAHDQFYGELLRTEEAVYIDCERFQQGMEPGAPTLLILQNAMVDADAVLGPLLEVRSKLTLLSKPAVSEATDEAYAALQHLFSYYRAAYLAAVDGFRGVFPLGEVSTKPLRERVVLARARYLEVAKEELGTRE